MNLTTVKENKTFGGSTNVFEHESTSTKTKMKFSAFIPDNGKKIENCIIWLSGLTCNEENFITKAGSQRVLKDTNTMIVCPDTSPRGTQLPNEHESYDFGSGAGFYLNATTEGYKEHYNMYDYIVTELVGLLTENFSIKKFSLMGHSMGGHGALVLGLRNPDLFSSVSAFSPMVNPSVSPWGKKALTGYLGDNIECWKEYDATELLKKGNLRSEEIFIDQGLADEFLEKELLTNNFAQVAKEKGQKLKLEYREGYDHSYYYIATFIEEHINFHLESLKN